MRKVPIAIRKMINLPQQSVKARRLPKCDATNQLINGMRLISRRITSLSLIHPWRPSLSRTRRPQRRETANQRQKPHSQSLCSVDIPMNSGNTASLLYDAQTRLLGTRLAIASCSSIPQKRGKARWVQRAMPSQAGRRKACAGLVKLVAAWYLLCYFGSICLLSYRAVRLFCDAYLGKRGGWLCL